MPKGIHTRGMPKGIHTVDFLICWSRPGGRSYRSEVIKPAITMKFLNDTNSNKSRLIKEFYCLLARGYSLR